jgi:rhomboid protease GluP
MALFGVSIIEPNSNDVFVWGGVFRPAVLDGEWYRIISAFFVHIGIVHLLMNMFALVMVGPQLELLLGKWRYLSAYVFCGIIASCSSLWWHPATVGAGASGAIFGLYGLFLALLSSNLLDKKVRKPLLSSIGIFVVYNLAFGLKDGIDNAAHIGGLVAGIIAGYSYYFGLRFSTNSFYKWKLPAIVLIVFVLIGLWTVSILSNPIGEYNNLIYEFQTIEGKAIEAQKKIQGMDEDKAMQIITMDIIPTWTKCNQIAEKLDELDINKDVNKRNDLIHQYTKNRLMYFETMFKASLEHSRNYDNKIDSLSKTNETILQTIKEM